MAFLPKFGFSSVLAIFLTSTSFCQVLPTPQQFPAPGGGVPEERSVHCGLGASLQQLRQDAAFKQREAKMNDAIRYYQRGLNNDTTTLPVVFHIINQNPDAITDQVIQNALSGLNDAFAKRGGFAASKGVDTKIRFCLSKKDPDGGITTGITRTTSYFSTHLNPLIEDAKLKYLVQWDPNRYINIWYVAGIDMEGFADFSCGTWSRTTVGGYATMPPVAGALDGIVVSDFGNLLTHEMGHYLGLYHTFETRNCVNNNCATDGDRVCDTPPDRSMGNSTSCNNPENSCGTDTLSNYSDGNFTADVPDQITNFMDYGNVACHDQFTQGQADRMLAAINTQRAGLLQNQCDKPCNENIVAGFTRSIAYPLPGDSISFSNTSLGATSYQWLLDDVVTGTGNAFGARFAAPGKYKVTLKAFNGSACFASYTDFIIVNCGVVARFYTDKRIIASRNPVYLDSISFTNTSENASTFKWLMSNDEGMGEQVISTNRDLVYVFPGPGNYRLRLIASNGSCTDTSDSFTIPVDDPTQDGVAYISTVNCYQQTKLRVSFYVCNNGYATLPARTPVSFYDADPRLGSARRLGTTFYLPAAITGKCCGFLYTYIVEANQPGLDRLFVVLNDSGNTSPHVMPNTPLGETNYANNYTLATNFRFRSSILPAQAVLEPGDTLALQAVAGPGNIASYNWSPALNLSCTNCSNPSLIADSTRRKRLIATSQFGCVDTSYIDIAVPPSDDFTIRINQVECAGTDSLFVNFTVQNDFRRGIIRKGVKVSFYEGDPSGANARLLAPGFTIPANVNAKTSTYSVFIKAIPEGKLYAVVNDSGRVSPAGLPNTRFLEKIYTNNTGVYDYRRFSASVSPPTAVLEPGDTLQLVANAAPGTVGSFTWSSAHLLSCVDCKEPFLVADSNRMKQVIVANTYGCQDTALAIISVPPANDYTLRINELQCAANSRLYVNFTLSNSFKRGVIPKGLTVAFYSGDPRLAGSRLLAPLFSVPDTAFAKQFTYEFFITGIDSGTVYAVVNDSGKTIPVELPGNLLLPEKELSNNFHAFNFTPETVLLLPTDTTVFRKTVVALQPASILLNPASTKWFNGDGYTLSCTQCPAPVVTVFDSSVVRMETANKYGCLLQGKANVHIYPPDFTLQILNTTCYSNSTTLVTFEVCMNNNYDSIIPALPVSFYDGLPSAGNRLLAPVFMTPRLQAGACFTYQHIVPTPASGVLTSIVNDAGKGGLPTQVFNETNFLNNTTSDTITPFTVTITPSDTTIARAGSITLTPSFEGGSPSRYQWTHDAFINCATCLSTTITPLFTKTYLFTAHNQYGCTDTATALVKVVSGGGIHVPAAFSPNNDGLNEVFYVFAGSGITTVQDFVIFNRWGKKVFEAKNFRPNDPRFGWDGNYQGAPAATGAYVYQLTLPAPVNNQRVFKGTVILLR